MPAIHHLRAAPLAALLLGGCLSENAIGFWDILSLELTWEGESQLQEDMGSIEVGEKDGSGGVVLRYEILDPTTVAVADTAGGAADWTVPISPPIVEGGPPADWDEEGVQLNLGRLRMTDIEIEDYRGTSMRVTCETAQIENAYDVDAVLELRR